MKYILPLLLIILFASCRSARKISTAIPKQDSAVVILNPMNTDSATKVTATLAKIKTDKIDFNTFSSKMKINYEGKDRKLNDVNAFLRMKKDSVIWVSIVAVLGIEAFRVMITPDTVSVMDKLNKTIQYHPFEYLREITKLPIDFKSLQDLILGNPIFLDSNVVAYSENDKYTSLTTLGKLFKNFSTFVNPQLSLERSKLDDVDSFNSRSADLFYQDYEQNNQLLFSTKRKISIADKSRIEIELEFKQVLFNTPMNFPFSVKEDYKLK